MTWLFFEWCDIILLISLSMFAFSRFWMGLDIKLSYKFNTYSIEIAICNSLRSVVLSITSSSCFVNRPFSVIIPETHDTNYFHFLTKPSIISLIQLNVHFYKSQWFNFYSSTQYPFRSNPPCSPQHAYPPNLPSTSTQPDVPYRD
jgi:hypothetical protein